jgi:hypothetical protein
MSIFHRVKRFHIDIYNQKIKDLLFNEKIDAFTVWSNSFDFQREHIFKGIKREPMDWVTKHWISSDWIKFMNWFDDNLEINLYRLVGDYNTSNLKSILKTGNDKHLIDHHKRFDVPGLDPTQYIHANSSFGPCWKYVKRAIRKDRVLILIYDSTKLKTAGKNPFCFTTIKEKGSFKDALKAVVLLRFKINNFDDPFKP